MMALLRNWLIGITAAALIAALADSLAPEGTVKKVGKLAGGLLLAAAIIQPLVGLDFGALAGAISKYQIQAEGYSTALENANQQLMKTIIEERTGAYIQDKAAELGAVCTVEVTCEADENGALYPASVVVYGTLNSSQTDALKKTIEGDLAIPVQRQQYERTKER